MENFWLILVGLIAYLLGSLSPAFMKFGKRVLEGETGIAGAMTVYRTARNLGYPLKRAAFWLLFVVAADGLKAVAAISIARWGLVFLGYNLQAGIAVSALFAVLGHNPTPFT